MKTVIRILPRSKKQRFLIFLSSGFLLTLLLSLTYHIRYWNGTIKAVQTTHLNLLSHSLPTKLSLLLINKQEQEIKNLLNSSYGFIGLIVTDCTKKTIDCPEQKIIYQTTEKKGSFKNININNLRQYHFDFLLNPPPIKTEYNYEKPYYYNPEKTGNYNDGEIIGRVYYIRSSAINKFDQVLNLLIRKAVIIVHPFTFFGILSLASFILAWLFIEKEIKKTEELAQFKKKIKEQEYEQELQRINNQKLQTENQLLEENQKRTEVENKQLEVEKQLLIENQKRIEAENQLLRLQAFASVFNHVVDQEFASVVGNQTQILRKICQDLLSKIENDARNIIHDIKKAPCLREENFVEQNCEEIINQFKNSDNSVLSLCNKLDKSIKIIDGVVQELSEITSTISHKVNVSLVLQELEKKLPPSILDISNITINFHNIEKPLFVMANSWHLKSIVRNALYNSVDALEDYYYDYLDNPDSFLPSIDIYLQETVDSINIIVRDNGLGIPENLVDNLYQSSERLNKSAGELKGNGSIIVFAYLTLHRGKAIIKNLATGGAEITFSFPKIPINSLINKK